MWYADSRRSFGPSPIGWYTFVARTMSSRCPLRCNHAPTVSSAMPYPCFMSRDGGGPTARHPRAAGPPRDAVPLLHVRRLGAAVDVGGIEEGDAGVDRGVHD